MNDDGFKLFALSHLLILVAGLWCFVTFSIEGTYTDESILIDQQIEHRFNQPYKVVLLKTSVFVLTLLSGPFCGFTISCLAKKAKRYLQFHNVRISIFLQ